VDKSRKGMFAFRRPEDVVREAMESFAKGKVVCIPDRTGKFIKALADLLPKKNILPDGRRICGQEPAKGRKESAIGTIVGGVWGLARSLGVLSCNRETCVVE